MEYFQNPFFVKALITAVLASVSCGIIGTYVVSRRLVFIAGGISHASLGGIGIALFLGINPILGAGVFAITASFGIKFFSEKEKIREDSLIGILWAFGMAVGIIFSYLTPGRAQNLMSFLIGDILLISKFDMYSMTILSAVLILIFTVFFRKILYLAFDEEYFKIKGISTRFMSYSLMALIAITIVIHIRVVGVILVLSLLTVPQATAGLFTKNFKIMILLSILFGTIGSIFGLFASYKLNIPSGATIIFSSILLFFFLKLLKIIFVKNQKKLANE